MRQSNRSHILAAAVEVVRRNGMTDLTYEAVAEQSGLTKGGLLYHFPSREALLLGIHEHLASQWEAMMLEVLGKPIESGTMLERRAAYAQVSSKSSSRADLLFMLEASNDPVLFEPFARVFERWAPEIDEQSLTDTDIDLLIARLAADGLWMYDSLTPTPLSPGVRDRIAMRIAQSILPPPARTNHP